MRTVAVKVTRVGAVVVPAVGAVVVANEVDGVVIAAEVVVFATIICVVVECALVVFTMSCVASETPSVNVVCDDEEEVVVASKPTDVDADVEIVVRVDTVSLVVFALHPHRRKINAIHRQNKCLFK